MAKAKPDLKSVPAQDNLTMRYKAKIGRVMQEAFDVRSELGTLYKEAEDAGLNRQAFKLAMKIENMDMAKGHPMVRDTLRYLCDMGYLLEVPEIQFAQGNLPLETVEPAA
jgi:uncharacterized protein (UPF0335 family)